jgi:L-ectoine synthase
MGFSLHETTIFAGTETYMHYKNHLEAVYCIGGEGEIEDLDSGETHEIFNGVMYALNAHDRHCLRTRSDMRLICVFTPALVGSERHDSDGGYPLIEVESHKATTPLPAGKG